MENTTTEHINLYGGKIIVARDSDTGEYLRKFNSMDELREVWPSAEITCIEENHNHIVVYC